MSRASSSCVLACCALIAGCSSQEGGDAWDGISCDPGLPASRTISCVSDFSPGEGAGWGQDAYPEIIYGEPKGGGAEKGSTDVLSLGKDGSITIGFGGSAIA